VVNLALLAVGAAAICSGGAAVLQASAVRRLPTASAVNARFVVRLARSPRYLMALALVVAGFGSSILALRSLPLSWSRPVVPRASPSPPCSRSSPCAFGCAATR